MALVRVGVAGACGRMGRAIIASVQAREGAEVSGVWERAGVDASSPISALELHDSPDPVAAALDVVIDFTAPEATAAHARWCRERGVALVVGTTGLGPEQHALLDAAAADVAVVQAPNMSVGVNALLSLVEDAARMLGGAFDAEIVETHHRAKKDAPSGTALALLNALQAALPPTTTRFERYGAIGARPAGEIGVQTLRGGDVVGEHTVFLFGDGERLELTHRATDRRIFADGAVRAALWAAGREPGRYSMRDVLRG